ncbi:MAG: tetratricopeptide repeat protein [Pyrinomonadaceae bacterium]|nr:tetratricopeptide repeat protein [Pyrinomonadaceae bacterium]
MHRTILVVFIILTATAALFAQSTAADYFDLGNAKMDRQDCVGAIADYTKAIDLDPRYAAAFNNRGICRENQKDLDGAISDYTKAIEFDPRLAEAFNNRGGIRNKRDDLDGAFSDYTRAIELNGNYALAYFNRGIVRFQKKDNDGAIGDYTRSLELDPRQPRAYFNRGFARFLKEDQDGAVADYTRAIELDPGYLLAYSARAAARTKKLDHYGAVADHTKAIELGDEDSYYSRSWSKFLLKDTDGAFQDASTFLETNGLRGGSPPYAVILGYLSLKKAGKPVEARSFMQNWIKQFDPAAWTTKIMKYLNGEMTSAQLLALATDNDKLTEVHGYIGEMLLIAGDRTNAGLHFKWVRDRGVKTFNEFDLAIAELNRILPAKPVK